MAATITNYKHSKCADIDRIIAVVYRTTHPGSSRSGWVEHLGSAPFARYRSTDVKEGPSTKLRHYNDKEIGMEYGGTNADNRHWSTTDAA